MTQRTTETKRIRIELRIRGQGLDLTLKANLLWLATVAAAAWQIWLHATGLVP